jgi:Ni/Co efflux regulator RcnB
MFKPRTLAIAGSIAALSLAAAPIAQAASAPSSTTKSASLDYSRDAKSSHHIDRTRELTRDKSSVDYSRDLRDH